MLIVFMIILLYSQGAHDGVSSGPSAGGCRESDPGLLVWLLHLPITESRRQKKNVKEHPTHALKK